MSNQLEKIKELIDRRAAARLGGGESNTRRVNIQLVSV